MAGIELCTVIEGKTTPPVPFTEHHSSCLTLCQSAHALEMHRALHVGNRNPPAQLTARTERERGHTSDSPGVQYCEIVE